MGIFLTIFVIFIHLRYVYSYDNGDPYSKLINGYTIIDDSNTNPNYNFTTGNYKSGIIFHTISNIYISHKTYDFTWKIDPNNYEGKTNLLQFTKYFKSFPNYQELLDNFNYTTIKEIFTLKDIQNFKINISKYINDNETFITRNNIFDKSNIILSIDQDIINIHVSIPIVRKNQYTLIKTIQTPVTLNNQSYTLNVNEYFIIDISFRFRYTPINESETQKCNLKLGPSKYLCLNSNIPLESHNKSCEIFLLTNYVEQIWHACQFTTTTKISNILHHEKRNTYTFITESPIILELHCNKSTETLLLKNSGTLVPNPKCKIQIFKYLNNITISNITSFIVPAFEVTQENINNSFQHMKTNIFQGIQKIKPNYITTVNNPDSDSILTILYQNLYESLLKLKNLNTTETFLIYSIILISAIIFLICIKNILWKGYLIVQLIINFILTPNQVGNAIVLDNIHTIHIK